VTDEVEARRAAAAGFARRYAELPGVVAVLCAGSTGRGHADRWSDLELGVLWARPPRPEERHRVAGTAARFFEYDEPSRSWCDDWWTGAAAGHGLLVECSHLAADGADALLDDLFRQAEPDPYLLTFAAALAYGQPLHGSIDRWADRVRVYPRPLAARVVRRLGQIDHFWRWQMYRDRGDPHGLRAHFAGTVTAVIHVLCALNRRWWPGPKWPAWALADLPIAPPDAWRRLAAVDALPPDRAATELAALVEQVYDLVAEHLPEADPETLRTIFRLARRPWPA
jgi:hypothetical protein